MLAKQGASTHAPGLPEGKTLGELPVMEQNRKKTSKPYSPEFRERAVRLVAEHRDEYRSDAAAHAAIASKLGCSPDSLRDWVRQAQRDGGERPGPTSAEKARIKELERENRELRQANEILKKASAYFAQAELDRPFRK
jgi:transposase